MQRTKLAFTLFICSFLCSFSITEVPFSIGKLDNSNYAYLDGAGCYFHSADTTIDLNDQSTWKYTFLNTITVPRKGWINIGGEVIELRLAKDKMVGGLKVGEPYKQIFSSGDLSVTVDGTIKEVSHEHWRVEGVIIVKQGKRETSIKVAGSCGS